MKKILILFLVLASASNFLYSQGFEIIPGPENMGVTRLNHAVVSLPDGKVLAIGGHDQGFGIPANAEIFDPTTSTWTQYNIDNPHDGASFVKLNDGKFMFYGGFSGGGGSGQSNATTIFDPATSLFSNGPTMNVSRAFSTAIKLSDNRVLIVGNWYNTGDAEIYDPVANTYTSVGTPGVERSLPLVLPCNDGGAAILGGVDIYGSTSYTDVVYFDPTASSFTTLSAELITGETGWITYWYSNFGQISDLKLSNGNYIFMIYKINSASEYEYAFAEFNPETKEVTKLTSTPAIPNYTGTSPNEWSYGVGLMKDPSSDDVYVFGHGSTTNPYAARLYAFDPQTGTLEIPTGQTGMDYHLYSSSRAWVNGDILCTGGSIDGSNFNVTNQVTLIRPQNSLSIKEVDDLGEVSVYPNPVSGEYFQIRTDGIEVIKIDILDIKGLMVKSIKVDASEQIQTVESGDLSDGVYFVRVSGVSGVMTKKIVLE